MTVQIGVSGHPRQIAESLRRCHVAPMLTITAVLIAALGAVDEPELGARLGAGALVMPARVQSLAGPAIWVSYSFGPTLRLDGTVAPVLTLTQPTGVAMVIGVGPTWTLGVPHSLVLGARAVAIGTPSEPFPGLIAVAGYGYRRGGLYLEALLGVGLVSYAQARCLEGVRCEGYFVNPHRYPALAVTISPPLL